MVSLDILSARPVGQNKTVFAEDEKTIAARIWVWHKRNGMPAHGKRLLEPWLGTRSNGKSW